MKSSFSLGMEPKDVNIRVTEATVARIKPLKPELQITSQEDVIYFEATDENDERMIQAFIGHIALKEAAKLGIAPAIR